MFKLRALHISIAGLMLMLAACGGDESASTTADLAPTTAVPATSATTLPPEDPPPAAGEDRSGELIGRWEVTNYTLPDGGGITNVVGDGPVFIEFNADGTVRYNTGCNSGGTTFETSGTYYVPESALDDNPAGQPITLGSAFEQTEIGCDGFLGDQDVDLPANMGAATRFVIDGDRLRLVDVYLLIEATK